MDFAVTPTLHSCPSLSTFFDTWQVGAGDLIVTNAYVLNPALDGRPCPCDTLLQEEYGGGEPTDDMVDAMLVQTNKKPFDRIIAIGGGTVIDIAKLMVFGQNLSVEQIYAGGAKLDRHRTLIVIPTTCGTGSEMTNISIVDFKKKHTKLGLAVPALYPDAAVLIADMLKTLPYEVFATSSIDALIHALESYLSPKASYFSQAFGRGAMALILAGYRDATAGETPALPADMAPMLAAASMAGIAFGNAGCAAVHALSYPLGGNHHLPHGLANYLLLEGVFNQYKRLGATLAPLEGELAILLDCPKDRVWPELFALLDRILPRRPLGELGVDEKECHEMATSVTENQQRLLANTPVGLTTADIEAIYKSCM